MPKDPFTLTQVREVAAKTASAAAFLQQIADDMAAKGIEAAKFFGFSKARGRAEEVLSFAEKAQSQLNDFIRETERAGRKALKEEREKNKKRKKPTGSSRTKSQSRQYPAQNRLAKKRPLDL